MTCQKLLTVYVINHCNYDVPLVVIQEVTFQEDVDISYGSLCGQMISFRAIIQPNILHHV